MTIVELKEVVFSHAEMAEFTQYRIHQIITAGDKVSITLPVPYNRIWFIYRYKFGDITVNVLNFNWQGVRNARENVVLLGTEHTNFDTRPVPFLIAKGTSGKVTVENTSGQDSVFEMTLDVCEIHENMVKELQKMLEWKFKV